MNINKKYKLNFASKVHKISNVELDKYISLAGLEKLKPLMPDTVNLDENPDLIGVCLNAAVAGYANLNGDAIDNPTAVGISKNFIWKFVDLEHKREKLIGVICNYGFSEYGTNKILKEEDLKDYKEPFNISLALLLYKSVLSQEYIDNLEKSANENNSAFGSINASWELYFDNYSIYRGSKVVSEASEITDEKEIELLSKYLQCNGGVGQIGNDYIYRVINKDYLIPTGIGLVNEPAAAVKGLEIVANLENKEKIEKTCVNIINETKTMAKITKISELTDENLKEVKASTLIEMVAQEIKVANDQYVSDLNAKANFAKELEAKNKEILVEAEKTKSNLIDLTDKFNKLNDQVLAKQKEDTFQNRMAGFDEVYALTDDIRSDIVNDIKDLDDTAFSAYSKKMAKLLPKKGPAKPADPVEPDADDKAKATLANVAKPTDAPATAAVVDNALDNAIKTEPVIPNTSVAELSLKDKYAKAFGDSGFKISL